MTEADRRKHIEAEAVHKTTVLNEFKHAKQQRIEDKEEIKERLGRIEKNHKDTITIIFNELKTDRGVLIANQTNIANILLDIKEDVKPSIATLETDAKARALKIGGGAGSLGAGIMIALKELWTYIQAQLGGN